jgi:lysophospholipid acyltransferase (LPLAT)-like uncharacterized protein
MKYTESKSFKKRFKTWRRSITYSEGFYRFITSLIVFIIKSYLALLNIKADYHPEFKKLDKHKALYAFWHGRLLLLAPMFKNWRIIIMTDKSWAGEILAHVLTRFGNIVVRGSSKRGGVRGILDMRKAMRQGHGGALAVDGPRGPVYRTKPGILYLSQKFGYPIVPLAFGADRVWVLESTWDKFVIPKPFAKCYVEMGAPIWKSTEKDAMNENELDKILMDFTAYTDRKAGRS